MLIKSISRSLFDVVVKTYTQFSLQYGGFILLKWYNASAVSSRYFGVLTEQKNRATGDFYPDNFRGVVLLFQSSRERDFAI